MTDDEMRARRRLSNRVDNDLSRDEQETSIHFYGDANRFEVTTYAPPMVRKLLRHAHAQIEWCYVECPDGSLRRVSNLVELADAGARHRIEGVRATLPLGAFAIKGKPRKRDIISGIVTTPEDLEGLEEAFADGGGE